MKTLTVLAAVLLLAAPATATPQPGDTRRAETLGALCEEGLQGACAALVAETGGNCAAPAGSGCRYLSTDFYIVDPEEPMVIVPGLEHHGWSRVSTVQHCQYLTGAADWQELMTDSELEGMDACMHEHT